MRGVYRGHELLRLKKGQAYLERGLLICKGHLLNHTLKAPARRCEVRARGPPHSRPGAWEETLSEACGAACHIMVIKRDARRFRVTTM